MNLRFLTVLLVGVFCGTLAAYAAEKPKFDDSVSVIGNSFLGVPDWVQQDIHALHVTSDGTIYTNVPWDEAGRNAGVYKNGKVIGNAQHTHGWGYNGGEAIAVNDDYVFIAQSVDNEGGGLKDAGSWPPKDFKWLGISRRLKNDISAPAPFDGGKGGAGDTLKNAFLVVAQVPENFTDGIVALWADNNRVYIGDPFEKQFKIYDVHSMKLLSSWPLPQGGPMIIDAASTCWMLQSSNDSTKIVHLSLDGKLLPQQITFDKTIVPVALCLDNRGRLLVADDGVNQQIRIYDNLAQAPRFSGTFGTKGGIYAGTEGAFGALKFNSPRAIGCDAQGNITVAHDGQSGGGGTVLENYAPNGTLNWRLFGLTFVDMADVDPANLDEVFTKEEHFRLGDNASWNYQGYTIQRFHYPQDPRLHIWSAGAWVRRIAGQKFLFVNDMNGENLQVYRFDNAQGEIAIPCALFAKKHIETKDNWPLHQPQQGEWIWRDTNGNGAFDEDEYSSNATNDAPNAQGWWVDESGNVWLATEKNGIRQFPIQGLDAHGVPQWNYGQMRVFPHLAAFEEIKRLRYDAKNDVMYIGGTNAENKNQHWKPMGPVMARYDNWLKGNTTAIWQVVAPYAKGSQGHESCEPMGFDVAGDYLFVPYTGASKELGFSTGHVEIFTAKDGKSAGAMEPPPEIGEVGLQDIRECLSAHRTDNGEYRVFLEDDYKSKIVMYRFSP